MAHFSIQQPAPHTHSTNNNPLLFGHWIPASEYLDGLIDEVRLYSREPLPGRDSDRHEYADWRRHGNKPPTVTLTAPANGATFTAPASVTLSATASDSDGTISKVEFYNGTTLLGTDTTSLYSFSWTSVAAGTYTVKAVAYDNSGASTSTTATITVNGPPTSRRR